MSGHPDKTHKIAIPALDREIECSESESLFAAARRGSVRVVGACGGRGTCGSCIVSVASGRIHREGGEENKHRKWVRSCQIYPRSDLELTIAPRSLAPIARADVRTGGENRPLPHNPAVRALEAVCEKATLDDLAPDTARVGRALGDAFTTVGCSAAQELPRLLRANEWRVQARLAGTRAIAFARPQAPLLGLAVDLGTTNAAAFLIDLDKGQLIASMGLENPQVAWGADLISRINQAIKDDKTAEALRVATINAINAMAHDLTFSIGAKVDDIADVVVCGNTAMQHLLVGWPVEQLGRAPFVAAMLAGVDTPAQSVGLKVSPGAQLHLAAGVGGFVGGDHVTAMLATEDYWKRPGVTLVMDIGTNTEISLVDNRSDTMSILSTSCPSGPALEGGHITNGMRAAEGAIEKVAIENGVLQLGVIGDEAPIGLCGSGVLDALASFVRAGWIDARGRIVYPEARTIDGKKAIVLAEETAEAPAVQFSQDDVRAVQLAKSAIRTGAQLLGVKANLNEQGIDRFVIAGAFGAYISVESAIAIGLLPDLPRDRFVQVGNAAGLGVQQMLSSLDYRARATAIAQQCQYVELSTRSDFQKTFLAQIGFAS